MSTTWSHRSLPPGVREEAEARSAVIRQTLQYMRGTAMPRGTPMDVDAWLASRADLIAPAMAKAQAQNLGLVDKTMDMTLMATGYQDSPIGLIVPEAFTGYMPDGRELGFIKHAVANRVRERMALGASQAEAWKAGSRLLATIVQAGLIDTQRMAKAVAGLARPRTLYVRMANVPCCPRCAILAGKKGYWSKPFLRHPGCDCTQIPLAEGKDVELSGPHFDVNAYFKSLSEADQEKYFTKAGAEALRNGADYIEVVNSMQGMSGVGDDVKPFTSYGASRNGWRRLSVPEIIRRSHGDEGRMRDLLLQYRYIRPDRRYGPVSRVDFSKGWPHDRAELNTFPQERPKNDSRPVPSNEDWSHILDGEPIIPGKRIQGGHRYGTGRERKTEFPRWWSDEDVKKAVKLTLESPHASKVFGTTRVLYRVVDEVLLQVAYYPDPSMSGRMVLGATYPKNGKGVVKNINGQGVEQPLDVSLIPRE